jgi:AcrR family transcriptional regulator
LDKTMNKLDTRSRIQDVALQMFIDKGYEATSLREIAEELGVTKAALYYHFDTKEKIVTSLIDDRVARLEELVEWGRTLPHTADGRAEFIRRYAAELQQGRHHDTMRFFERNQTALRDHPSTDRMRNLMITMIELLSDEDAPVSEKLKHAMAIFAVHATWFVLRDSKVTDEERQAAGLTVALELVS